MHVCVLSESLKTVSVVVFLADNTEPVPFNLAMHEYSPVSSNLLSSILNVDSVKV